MTTFLILGGYGATGRLLAKHLLAQTDHEIVVAGRNLDKAQAFVDSLQNPRVIAKQVDGSEAASLKEALQGADFLLVAAPTTHHTETVVSAALEASVYYLDVQYLDLKLETLRTHEQEINARKLCFVTEAG